MMTWTKKLMLAAVTTLGMAAPALAHENVNHEYVQPGIVQPVAPTRFDGRFDNDRFDRRDDFHRVRNWRHWQRMRRWEAMRRHHRYDRFYR
jgi:hypothetical protein